MKGQDERLYLLDERREFQVLTRCWPDQGFEDPVAIS